MSAFITKKIVAYLMHYYLQIALTIILQPRPLFFFRLYVAIQLYDVSHQKLKHPLIQLLKFPEVP